ncbi:MAG: hypothetical protein RRX93_06080 [Bacteroidales bacterium]
MKKTLVVCALVAFSLVACKSNKTAEPALTPETTTEQVVDPAANAVTTTDTTACNANKKACCKESGKCNKAPGEACCKEGKKCNKAPGEACCKKGETKNCSAKKTK